MSYTEVTRGAEGICCTSSDKSRVTNSEAPREHIAMETIKTALLDFRNSRVNKRNDRVTTLLAVFLLTFLYSFNLIQKHWQ